jgi:hypothetical protein
MKNCDEKEIERERERDLQKLVLMYQNSIILLIFAKIEVDEITYQYI